MIIPKEKVQEYLSRIAKEHPSIATARLAKGSMVEKGSKAHYEIDDVDIDRRLETFALGAVPYGPIYRALRSSKHEIQALFNTSNTLPFSRAFDTSLGECMEKAILVQLAAQRGEAAFLINGCLFIESEVGTNYHGYNIVVRNNEPFLIDVQNPLAVQTSTVTHPYIAPIIGILEKGQILVPREWSQGREYSLT